MSETCNTRREVSKAMLDRALNIKGFEFTDKSGAKWSNKSYFEMLACTELMNAARASYDDKMAEAADREKLHRLISTLPIEKVRELLKELH